MHTHNDTYATTMGIVNGLEHDNYVKMGKVIFGHELWLENPSSSDGRVSADLMYGHNMEMDGVAPKEYVNPTVLDAGGAPMVCALEQIEGRYRISFDAAGQAPYTMYIESLPVIWNEINDGTWKAGVKRDFSGVKSSASYQMYAKCVFSDDAASETEQAMLEIVPLQARLKVGEDASFKVLYEGKPLAGREMKFFSKGTGEEAYGKTGADGIVSLRIDHPGDWMMLMRHKDSSKSVESEFDETVFIMTLVMRAV